MPTREKIRDAMCGIAGIIDPSSKIAFNKTTWEQSLKNMASAMAHRGPDDEGIWFDRDAGTGFAHRRLSIIDLSAEGHQPMVSLSGRFVLTYNGEIYNFKAIQADLEKEDPIQLKGESDTEVLLTAIERWGVQKAVRKTIGMFAFSLWDRKNRTLTLCRDRLGIKPLYYGTRAGVFFFSSELKPIMSLDHFKPEINRDALTLYFRHNTIPAPYSIFKGIKKLQPGTILTIEMESIASHSHLPEPKAYWSYDEIQRKREEAPPQDFTETDAIEMLKSHLKDAISHRMISDVPIGAFLSGGIDSSVVVAIMQEVSPQKVKTFSIGFEEMGYNEAHYAKAVANHLKTDHTELYVTSKDALDVIPKLPHIFDEPFADSSQIPTYLLSKLTREHVTVSLSGDGGDELFGGYNRHFLGKNIRKLMDVTPLNLRKWVANQLLTISPLTLDAICYKIIKHLPSSYKMDMPGDRIHKLAEILKVNEPHEIYTSLISHFKDPESLVRKSVEPKTIISKLKQTLKGHGFSHQMMVMDLLSYLPDDILTKVDRASMGASLEARVPLLDHRLVAFAFKLPLSMKIRGNKGKWILRRVLDEYVPNSLIDRPKTGFGIPMDAWLRGPLKEWGDELLNEKKLKEEGILDAAPIQKMWQEHQNGKKNWHYHLWDVLMFQSFKSHYRL